MTKISKEIKLKVLIEHFEGNESKLKVIKKYGISKNLFAMLASAYKTHGSDILFDPPQVTGKFRIELIEWKIRNNASYTDVAAKFGYVGSFQINQWKKIYRQKGPNGLLSIQKGRKVKIAKQNSKKSKQTNKISLEQNRIKQLENENLELRIKNEALKLLASMKQPTDKKQK
jgi:transposase